MYHILTSTFDVDYRMEALCDMHKEKDEPIGRIMSENCICRSRDEKVKSFCDCTQKAGVNDWYPLHGGELEGMFHNIAYKAWNKSKHLEGEEIFNKAVAFCDMLEEDFRPELPRAQRLSYDNWKKAKKAQSRVNLHRFKLKSISYEQWAYLSNWLNVLMSVDKEFACEAQNIAGNQFIPEEELDAYTVELVYYTKD